jgi:hypothetical protein
MSSVSAGMQAREAPVAVPGAIWQPSRKWGSSLVGSAAVPVD